jgi:hypothetical protein
MKQLMTELKRGGAISELFSHQDQSKVDASNSRIEFSRIATEPALGQSHKATRLDELKRQRQFLEEGEKHDLAEKSLNDLPSLELSKISQIKSIQKSLMEVQRMKESALNQEKETGRGVDQLVISELNQREKDLGTLLENF